MLVFIVMLTIWGNTVYAQDTLTVERIDPIKYYGKRLLLPTVTTEDELYDRLGYALSQGADYVKIAPNDGKPLKIAPLKKTYSKAEQLRKTYDATLTLKSENGYLSSKSLGKDAKITVSTYVAAYRYNDKIAKQRIKSNKKATELYKYCKAVLQQYIKPENSDATNLSLIRNYVIARIEYERIAEEKNDDDYSAYGALVEGKSVCAGYSRAFCLLMRMSGYKCWIVAGTAPPDSKGKRTGHSWNAYRINGKLYFTDCTWADGGLEQKDRYNGMMYTFEEMEQMGYEFFLSEEDVEKLCKY